MPLEPVTHLDDLVVTNPTDTDPVSEGDNHIRNLKIALAAGVTGDAAETRLLALGVLRLLAVASGADIVTDVDQALELRLLNRDTPDIGIALEQAAGTGKAAIRETDGAGLPGNAWITLSRDEGVSLLFADIIRIASTALGAQVDGELLDVNNSLNDVETLLTLRNNIGSIRMLVQNVTGNAEIQQSQSDGVSVPETWISFARNGAVACFFDDVVAMRTADRTVANSSAEIFDNLGNVKPVGFNSMVQIATPGTFTVSDDENGTRQRTGNVGITVTLPNSALVSGWSMILQKGTVTGSAFDTITTPGTLRWYKGDEILTGNRSLGQGGVCTIAQNSTGVYDIWGNGLT